VTAAVSVSLLRATRAEFLLNPLCFV